MYYSMAYPSRDSRVEGRQGGVEEPFVESVENLTALCLNWFRI